MLTKINNVEKAIEVADRLEKSAIHHWDYITWLQRNKKPQPYHLYDGCSGIAVFFAALYHKTGEKKYRKLALKAIQPLNPNVHAYYGHTESKENAISITIGYPSYIYAFLLISHFLNEDFDAYIQYYLSFITKELIEADETIDVMHGSSGMILALLKVYNETKNDVALELAMTAGEHVTTKSINPFNTSRPLTGFAHGAAGISYALSKLYNVTKVFHFKETAQTWLEYERALYSKEHRNWPDLRNERPIYLNSWCHGATGIGLARLGSLSEELDNTMIDEIDNVLTLNLEEDCTDPNHLCCGNFGRLEFFITYSEKLYQIKSTDANHYVQKILRGTNLEETLSSNVQNPTISAGLFLGLAGIGYQFLRLCAPKHYPSILLFE